MKCSRVPGASASGRAQRCVAPASRAACTTARICSGLSVSPGNNGAIPLATFEPMMPRKAALAGLATGKVLVEFTVTERGTVSNIRIVKEEPRSYDLGKAARQTITKWTFKPAMIDGKPQASRMQQEIEFATN
jgi:protein TonB